MSAYAYVNYEDMQDMQRVVKICDSTLNTELHFGDGCELRIGELFVSTDVADGSKRADVVFPFNRDPERRNRLVDWFMQNGLCFRVVV